jgi:hypothetical protein
LHLISHRSSRREGERKERRQIARRKRQEQRSAVGWFVGWVLDFGVAFVAAALYRRVARVFLGAALAPVGLCAGVRYGRSGWAGIYFGGREGRGGARVAGTRSRRSEPNGGTTAQASLVQLPGSFLKIKTK